ncbi:MAG TPA: hypothetical protein DCO77_08675, partial [Nitrospiraceae bacterium]|nr:hypothetical protein [Nitrospiraceae bacterium]
MKDEYKTKKQLIQELTEARNRIAKKEDASGDIVAGREIVRNITERKEAEKELKVFQDLINRTNDAIFVIDPETSRFLNVNEKTCSNLGYQREELFSMSVTDIEAVLPNRFSWSEHVKAVKKAGHMILEGRHKHKDGTEFPVEVSVTYIQCQPKDYMVAVVRDVTERKKAAEALTAVRGKAEAEHAKAEAIVAALGAGIGILDRDFKLLYQNQAHRDILGGHSGEYCYQAFHERDHVCESCPVEMTFADGNIHTVERTVPGDEGERFIEVTTSPLKDRTGTIVAGIEVVTDITGRKLVENSRAMLREAIESLPIGITIGDLSGKIVYVNHAEAEIHGFQAAELIGKDTRMLAPPDTWEPLSFEKLYAMGTRKRESVNIRKNGDVFPVQLISRAVKNTEGV